jgi:membrane dipeptidase
MNQDCLPLKLLLVVLLSGCATSARTLHESLLTLDTHLDTPALLGVADWHIDDEHSVQRDGSQVDLPRMLKGGLDGGFWATYIPQGPLTPAGRAAARDAALLRLSEIHAMVAHAPDKFAIALTAADAPRIAATHRRIVYLSMENGYPVGEDISLLKTFYQSGVRIAGPVHFLNNDLGTSATDTRPSAWKGLSPLGELWVAECNRLGILIDASHASDAVLDQLLLLSRAPIILTHSGAKAIFDHPRNVDDQRLRQIAAHGGVVQVSAYSNYMVSNPANPDRDAAMVKIRTTPARSEAALQLQQEQLHELDDKFPSSRASFDDYLQHLLHVLKIAGVDHTGIGLDLDGGGGVTGLEDAADYHKITTALLAAGYSRIELQKIWGGNALRVLREAQELAKSR